MALPHGNPQTAYSVNANDLVKVDIKDGKPVVSGNCYRLNTILQQLNARIPGASVVSGRTAITINVQGSGGGGGTANFWTQSGGYLFASNTSWIVLVGLTSTDLSLLPGAIVSSDAVCSVSSTSNASVISIAATPPGGCDVSVGKTGSGALLPLRFFINPNEVARFLTTGQLLVGLNSTDLGFANHGAIVSNDTIVSATAKTNASIISMGYSAGNYTAISSGRSGASGTFLPLTFWTTNTERVRVLTTGQLLSGLSSTDLSLGNGAIVSNDALCSATAGTNCSVGSFAAIAATYVAIASSRTGSGTFLPMTFFTNGAEAMRVNTSSHLLIGTTTDDGLAGDLLQVSNSAYISSSLVVGSWTDTRTQGTGLISTTGSNAAVGFWNRTLSSYRNNTGDFSQWYSPDGATGRYLTSITGDIIAINHATGFLMCGIVSTDLGVSRGMIVSSNALVSITGTTNASVGSLSAVAGLYVSLNSNATGSGSQLPLAFFVNAAERARITTGGIILSGLTSTDASLSAGSIVSANSLVSATATANASIGSLAAIAGNYISLNSNATGAGTQLPLAIFVNGAERMRILTGGKVLINRTTDDGSGAQLQVSGNISVNGTVLTVP